MCIRDRATEAEKPSDAKEAEPKAAMGGEVQGESKKRSLQEVSNEEEVKKSDEQTNDGAAKKDGSDGKRLKVASTDEAKPELGTSHPEKKIEGQEDQAKNEADDQKEGGAKEPEQLPNPTFAGKDVAAPRLLQPTFTTTEPVKDAKDGSTEAAKVEAEAAKKEDEAKSQEPAAH